MVLRIKKSSFICTLLCIDLAILALAASLNNFIPMIIQFLLVFAGYLFPIYYRKSISNKLSIYQVLLMFMLFFMLFNNPHISKQFYQILFLMRLCLPLFFCMFMSNEICWIDKLLRFLFVGYLLYGISSVILCYTPNLYINNIATLFPETEEQLVHQYLSGCMPGLTNHYSTNGMLMGLFTIFSCCLLIKKKKSRIYWLLNILCILLSLYALLLTGKRAHIIFTSIALIIVLFMYMSDKPKSRLLKMLLIVLAILTFLLFAYFFAPQLVIFLYRFEETASKGDITLGRVKMWEIAIKAFIEYPVFGIGWGNYSKINTVILNNDAHNSYVQLLCETGLIGILVFISWFIGVLVEGIKLFLHYVSDKLNYNNELYYLALSISIQIFFLLYCLTGNPLTAKEMYFPYYISCSIVISLKQKYIFEAGIK